jgi:hypothetical protein
MDDEADYILRLIAARCGDEVADAVIPNAVLVHVLAAFDALEARLAALSEAVETRDEIEGYADPQAA